MAWVDNLCQFCIEMSLANDEITSVPSLCGVWVDTKSSEACLAWENGEGARREERVAFRPFVWAMSERSLPEGSGQSRQSLSGSGEYDQLVTFDDCGSYSAFVKEHGSGTAIDWARLLENQFLLSKRTHLFEDLNYAGLRRMQLDIETASSRKGRFPDARLAEDRVLAIGLRCGGFREMIVLSERSDEAEKALLARLNECIRRVDPDVIEGHNVFKFDLDYLRIRAKRIKVPCRWGRFGQLATFRKTRLRVAERWIEYPRCDLPGRAVVDTFLLAQIYDITKRELTSYGLKDVARYMGVTPADGGDRTYIEGDQIQVLFEEDRERFLAYLSDDLRETEGVANQLLPTYFEQVKAFPTTLQEACLRGTASKVDLVFLEEYYHRGAACPAPGETSAFAGGYTASFKQGVYKNVLHFDVASLYPSLLLLIGRNPKRDSEGVFIPMLQKLRTYRLKYKQMARVADDGVLAAEYTARQTSFKILINSFYGYLGFSGARFGDADLAAEVTAKGRELLHELVAFFDSEDCQPLEADTDGIYVTTEKFFDDADSLLAQAQTILPEGIELEYDGQYVSMFCYKAKNYALYDGAKVIIRGSGLRSRGIEPYLKTLTRNLIHYLLGASTEEPGKMAMDFQRKIESREMGVHTLAKSEVLSMNPEAYLKKMESGGKPRRASAEVALTLGESASMGDRVAYYVGLKSKGATAVWQRAISVDFYDAESRPYDSSYYTKKLDEWRKRYAEFYPALLENPDQGNLFA